MKVPKVLFLDENYSLDHMEYEQYFNSNFILGHVVYLTPFYQIPY